MGEERNMRGGWRKGKVLPVEGTAWTRAERGWSRKHGIPPGAVVGGFPW